MLTRIQSRIARIMAAQRNQASYFAGGTVLNENAGRMSDDLDVFHDSPEDIHKASGLDIAALRAEGLHVDLTLDAHEVAEADIHDGKGGHTVVQWMTEPRMRFFPLVSDPLWGLRLHRTDLAVNKAIAAAMRSKTRDMADILMIQETYCPLGPLLYPAAMKADLFSPLLMSDRIRRHAIAASTDELANMRDSFGGRDPGAVKRALAGYLDDAERFLRERPAPVSDGLAVDAEGVPVEKERNAAELRILSDGGGGIPAFPEQGSGFSPS